MGADLIGYFLVFPRKTCRRTLKQHARSLMKELSSIIDLERLRTGEFAPENVKKDKVDKFLAKYPQWAEEAEMCEMDPVDALTMVMKDVDMIIDFDPLNIEGRDINDLVMKINGEDVFTIFAGEMSWGDTPDGLGYQQLRAVWRCGAGDALWKSVNWGRAERMPRAPRANHVQLKL